MGEWKSVGLNEIVDLLKNNYSDETFTVGVDKDNMIYYVVPTSLGLDESISTVKESLKLNKVRDVIGSEGFPRDLYVWVEEGVGEIEGLLDEDDDLGDLSEELENQLEITMGTETIEKELDDQLEISIEKEGEEEEEEEKEDDKEEAGSDDGAEDLKKRIEELEEQLADAEDMEYLVAELDRLREENRELEKTLSEKKEGDIKIEKAPESDKEIMVLFKEFGGDKNELSGKGHEKIINACEFIKKTYSSLQDDVTKQEERIIELESEQGADKSYAVFFQNTLYDNDFAQKTVKSMSDLGIAPKGFSIDKLVTAKDKDGKEKYRFPIAVVNLVEKFDEIATLISKAKELQKRIKEQSDKAAELDRKITGYQEEEEEINKKITEEKDELKELDTVLEDIEKSGLGKLRDKLSKLLDVQKGKSGGKS